MRRRFPLPMPPNCFISLLGLAELVQQAVYILHLHAAPGGDAPSSGRR